MLVNAFPHKHLARRRILHVTEGGLAAKANAGSAASWGARNLNQERLQRQKGCAHLEQAAREGCGTLNDMELSFTCTCCFTADTSTGTVHDVSCAHSELIDPYRTLPGPTLPRVNPIKP